ncbi:hypothetical protein [Desulfovibrio inopinatus]|uniref:hypothetical protein n=1 Tax=Desulfovibrio inopinatus TaxID=102109 RepID=UPI0004855B22|nr:hypothetical protein [Desulfovibrio inopinatus]
MSIAHFDTSLLSLPDMAGVLSRYCLPVEKGASDNTVNIPKRINTCMTKSIHVVRRGSLFAPTKRTPILSSTRSACPTDSMPRVRRTSRFDLCGRRIIASVKKAFFTVSATAHAAAVRFLLSHESSHQQIAFSRAWRSRLIIASFVDACALPVLRDSQTRRIMTSIGEVCRKTLRFSGMANSAYGCSPFAINLVASN